MDDLVAAYSRDGRPQDLLRLGVHCDFHEPLGFALLHRAVIPCKSLLVWFLKQEEQHIVGEGRVPGHF